MNGPKLRTVEMMPIRREGKDMILLRDPEGVWEGELLISRELAFILLLMDGSRSLRDIQVEYMRSFGELLYTEKLEEILSNLDERYLLHSSRYENRLTELRSEYEEKQQRPPALAGRSYPADREELLSFLHQMFSQFTAQEGHPADIRGMLSPHIDYQRGARVYANVYQALKGASVKLVVVFGTAHRPLRNLWAVSLKDISTPLGEVAVPRGLKEIISRSHLSRYHDEWPHRLEHSIELQIPLLQYFWGPRIGLLPILMGSMEDFVAGRRSENDPEVEELLSSLKDCLERYGEPYILLSAADLAHIGFQFGDLDPLSPLILERSKRRDEMLLEAVRNVNASGFLGLIREEGDRRRICGLAPIYFQLRLLEGMKGEIISYEQWTDGLSSVSFAGGIFYRS